MARETGLSSGSKSLEEDVVWEGSPWVTPGLVALTAEIIVLAGALLYVELAWLGVESLVVGGSLLLMGLLWFEGAARLELLTWSNHYRLLSSSLEVQKGIVQKKVFTVSASGFSDLEVTRSLRGRIVNTGDIIIETDSHRDVALVRVRDPVKVSTMIRDTMTVPLVRVDGQPPLTAANGEMRR